MMKVGGGTQIDTSDAVTSVVADGPLTGQIRGMYNRTAPPGLEISTGGLSK